MAELVKTNFMVCQYKWELAVIENKPMTILSKMIKFQGVESFRVGLKNQATNPTLLLITTNLNKMGLKAGDVTFSLNAGTDEKKMTLITYSKGEEDATGSLQLFTAPLDEYNMMISGNYSFIFKIFLSGVVESYRAQEVDLLLRNQLWSSFTNQVGTDFEIIAEGKRFPVHKFLLAARSPVFAAKFKEENRGRATEEVSLVDAATVLQFIKYIYTGELEGPVKSQHLIQLASNYEIKTLSDLCRVATLDVSVDQMVSLAMELKPAEVDVSAMAIRPDADSEINILTTSVIFDCTWNPNEETKGAGSCTLTSTDFEYQQEKLFRAQMRKTTAYNPSSGRDETKIRLVLLSYHHEKMNYKVDEVTFSITPEALPILKMLEKKTSNNNKLQVFSFVYSFSSFPSSVTFHVKLSSAVPNFGVTFADSTWKEQLWATSIDKVLTDVEFLIADVSMSAHRSLLSARSSVFAAMFASGMEEARTGQVHIDDVDPDSFRHFLRFLYTGALLQSADKAKIFAVADKYQVETLMDLCRPSTQSLDIDEMTAAFLSC